MRPFLIAVFLLAFFTSFPRFFFLHKPVHQKTCRLWYHRPAINWNEALPIGNARMGAMIYGGVRSEHLQLNEQTLWSGGPRDWNNPRAKEYLPLVRNAVLRQNYREADSLSRFMQGPYTEAYLPMGDLFIDYQGLADSASYERSLSLDSAISDVHFVSGGKKYTRSAFASFPDKVIVLRNTCSSEQLSFVARLGSLLRHTVERVADNHIVLKGKCPSHMEPRYLWKIPADRAVQYDADPKGEGMTFQIDLVINSRSGEIRATDSTITVEHARKCIFIISAATSYNGYDRSPGTHGVDPSVDAKKFLSAARARSYDSLLQRHVRDYSGLFGRVQYDLGDSYQQDLPTDERLKNMKNRLDPDLVATVAQYGRYLLIAGSREPGLPVNLKGLWNDRLRPEYSSNWCLDHDAQMFYYAAETSNLSETHLPFLNFIGSLVANGRRTAEVNYGMHGWCAHHNTDIWRQTAPVGNYGGGNPHWATWNMSGPWLCAHLFDHYLFTGDRNFLRTKAWPAMKGAAEFYVDWLIKDSSGQLVSVPSVSPENTFITEKGDTAQISKNSTGDIALIKELYRNCIAAMEILHTDSALLRRLRSDVLRLPAYAQGPHGELLEWEKNWEAVDPSHRHLTHLYPVFPGREISPVTSPAWSDAAKKALVKRERTNCTWGFVLKAACWARLAEGDSAWNCWREQLRWVDPSSRSATDNYGLYPNLFNSDAPDVIMNGNGCATAVLTEMLLQSQSGFIRLLPALPSVFAEGSCKGLVARGGFVVDLSWSEHQLRSAVIHSVSGNPCHLFATGKIRVRCGNKNIGLTKGRNDIYSFATEKGKNYRISMNR